jgi:hypothetical protein
MYLDGWHKEILGKAGVNDTVRRDFAEFYRDYDFTSHWADIAEAEAIELAHGIPREPKLAAVAIKGVIMNGRAHEFCYTLHKYNRGPFSDTELAAIAEIVGLSREVIIMDDNEKNSHRLNSLYGPGEQPPPLEVPAKEIAA